MAAPVIVSGVALDDAPEAVALLQAAGTLRCLPPDRDALLSGIADCTAYVASAAVRVDAAFLDAAPNLRFIGSPHTGRDHLDQAAIAARGIVLRHIAEERALLDGFSATAEHAFALILAVIRHVGPAMLAARQGDWARERFTGFQLLGKTLGLVGLGRLGSIAARIGQGFGMRVIGCDPRPVDLPGVTRLPFDRVLADADVVSLHLHLAPETEGLIGRAAFAAMKPGAILINTSRGRIVDEAALIEALDSGRLGGAGLDVIDGEWMDDAARREHPLLAYARAHDNLVVTPHIGGATVESITGARIFIARKVADFLAGRPV